MNAIKEIRPRRKKPKGPREVPVLAYLASTFLRYGAAEKARSLYNLLVLLQPKQRRHRVALGFASLKCGRPEEALAHLEIAFSGRGVRMEGWEVLLLERTLRANGMIEEAKAVMRKILRVGEPA